MMLLNPYRFAPSGGDGSDPYWANVVLLLHFDGDNGATTTTDETGKAVTLVAPAALTNTAYKSPPTSLDLSAGGRATVPHSADFDFGAGDLTIEAWARCANVISSGADVLFCKKATDNGTGWCQVYREPYLNQLVASASADGVSNAFVISSAQGRLTNNAWHHIALTRLGNTWTLWIDGLSVGSATSSITVDPAATDALRIGANASGANRWKGQIDEFRITKGVSRYTSDGTPPAAPFPNS